MIAYVALAIFSAVCGFGVGRLSAHSPPKKTPSQTTRAPKSTLKLSREDALTLFISMRQSHEDRLIAAVKHGATFAVAGLVASAAAMAGGKGNASLQIYAALTFLFVMLISTYPSTYVNSLNASRIRGLAKRLEKEESEEPLIINLPPPKRLGQLIFWSAQYFLVLGGCIILLTSFIADEWCEKQRPALLESGKPIPRFGEAICFLSKVEPL